MDSVSNEQKKDVDKVNIEDLIEGLRIVEVKALEAYFKDIWKVLLF